LGVNGFQTSVDPQTVNPGDWAAKHFGPGHSADALARRVNQLATDWLEKVLVDLLAQGIGPDRAMVHNGPGVKSGSALTACLCVAGRSRSRRLSCRIYKRTSRGCCSPLVWRNYLSARLTGQGEVAPVSRSNERRFELVTSVANANQRSELSKWMTSLFWRTKS
jgi:hypothetical protein